MVKLKVLKKRRQGFTVIEVAIVVGITGLIVSSVMVGISTAIARRRYIDAVNNLSDYLRKAYSEVVNVQNPREDTIGKDAFCSIATMFNETGKVIVNSQGDDNYPGKSNCLVYGKLLTFGEEDNSIIYNYDVIGKIQRVGADEEDDAMKALLDAGVDVITVRRSEDDKCNLAPSGLAQKYEPQWMSRIQKKEKGQLFTGAVLIVRSPISGTVMTFVSEDKIEFQKTLRDKNKNLGEGGCEDEQLKNRYFNLREQFLIGKLKGNNFKQDDLAFCLDSDDVFAFSGRRAVRFRKDGRNAGAVEILPADNDEAKKICP